MSGNPTTRVPCGSNPLSDGGEAAAASTNWRRPSRCLPSSSVARSPVAPHSFPSSLSVSLRWCEIRCKSVAERKGDKDKAAVRSARLVRFGWSLTSQAHLSRFSSRGVQLIQNRPHTFSHIKCSSSGALLTGPVIEHRNF